MFVYLHGFASSPRSAKAVYLRERLRACGEELLIPELDGGDFEHLTITNQLRIITDAVAGKPVTLIGSSMGGYLAALYASDHHNVDRLLLLAPAFGFTERWPASLGQATAEQWSETGWLPVYHYGQGTPGAIAFRLARGCRALSRVPGFCATGADLPRPRR